MPIPTVQELYDIKTDADDLESLVNGFSTVNTRLGGSKDSYSQEVARIAHGDITTYSAAATYTEITDWVEESGLVYRPIPSQLPIGPEAFDSAKWIIAQGIGAGDSPNYIAAEFATVADMIAGNSLNLGAVDFADYIGREVSVVANNTKSNDGEALYEIVNSNPGNLSSLVDGVWAGRNHDLGGGNYAKLKDGAVRNIMQHGAVMDTSHADGDINFAAFSSMIQRTTYAYDVRCELPPGDLYMGDNGLSWGHYRTIQGVGREATRVRFNFDGVDEDAFRTDQFNYLYDFTIINDGTDQSTCGGWVSFVGSGDGANGAANSTVKNIDIRNFGYNITSTKVGGSRLTFSNVFNTRFEGVRCYNGLSNIFLGAAVNNTVFIDCWFKDSRGRNIRGSEWLSATFIGCADEGTAVDQFSGYFTLCQNVRFLNSYHEPMRGFFVDTCPGFVLDRPQINGFSPVSSGTGSNRVLGSFWTLNGAYSFSTPSPVYVYAPIFNTTDDLSSFSSWLTGGSNSPARLIGVPTDRSGTLPELPEAYLTVENPEKEIADNSVSPSAITSQIAREINFSQFGNPASGSVILDNISNEFGILVAKVFNSTGTFRIVCTVAGNNISIVEQSQATGSVFTLSISSGDLTYNDQTGAGYDLSFQSAFYSLNG